jgi:hypothetical protein
MILKRESKWIVKTYESGKTTEEELENSTAARKLLHIGAIASG